jgi:hypothetical protein
MTAAEFKVLFPEFVNAADALVTSRIAWAEPRTPLDIWGDLQEQGIAFLTAHFLALLPNGKEMRKGEKPGESMYLRERERLEVIVSSGFRIAGGIGTASSVRSWRAGYGGCGSC